MSMKLHVHQLMGSLLLLLLLSAGFAAQHAEGERVSALLIHGHVTAVFLPAGDPELGCRSKLAEPHMSGWVPEIAGGQAELDKFMERMWGPAAEASRHDDPEAALRITGDYFSGKGSYHQVPPE